MHNRPHTEEVKRKIRESQQAWRRTGEYQLFLERQHERGKKSLTQFKKGHLTSENTRKKISDAVKKLWNDGKYVMTKEHHDKIISTQIGKKRKSWGHHSEETKKKASERMKKNPIRMLGDKHPGWRGGISFEPYGMEFNKRLKMAIKERDGSICIECGISGNKRRICVHHIDYNKRNNDSMNLISLCEVCHSKTNWRIEDWRKYYSNKVNRLFLNNEKHT